MSRLKRAVDKVADAAVAVGEFVADQVRPTPVEPPRTTPAVRKAARKAAIKLAVGKKQRGVRK